MYLVKGEIIDVNLGRLPGEIKGNNKGLKDPG